MIRRTKLIMAIILITLFASGLLGANAFISSEADAFIQQMQAGIEEVKAQLDSGSVLHLSHQTFQRYGPAVELITKLPWALPEMSYSEQWLGVDTAGNFSSYESKATDAAGEIYQESTLVNAELICTNADSSKSIRVDHKVISVDEFLHYAVERANRLIAQGWQAVGNGTWDGEETVVLEIRNYYPLEIPSLAEDNDNSISFSGETDSQDNTSMAPESPANSLGITESFSISIPYIADLVPQEVIHRIEIMLDNPMWTCEQVIVVDEEGREILVLESKTTTVEVIH